jgi:hypothetical protein
MVRPASLPVAALPSLPARCVVVAQRPGWAEEAGMKEAFMLAFAAFMVLVVFIWIGAGIAIAINALFGGICS